MPTTHTARGGGGMKSPINKAYKKDTQTSAVSIPIPRSFNQATTQSYHAKRKQTNDSATVWERMAHAVSDRSPRSQSGDENAEPRNAGQVVPTWDTGTP